MIELAHAAIARLRAELDQLEAMLGSLAREPTPDLATWYAARARTVARSTEEDDHEAAAAAGFRVGRAAIRMLRRQHAPDHWRRPGRRSG